MELFASPMACSLASHITALEAGLPVKLRFVENKKTDDGGDYYKISAKGYVPALRLDDGQILNEGPSVLQYLADAAPHSSLAPAWGTLERYQLIDMLNYLSTEVQGGFIGRTIGLFASGCVAEFRWFEYESVDRPPPEV